MAITSLKQYAKLMYNMNVFSETSSENLELAVAFWISIQQNNTILKLNKINP